MEIAQSRFGVSSEVYPVSPSHSSGMVPWEQGGKELQDTWEALNPVELWRGGRLEGGEAPGLGAVSRQEFWFPWAREQSLSSHPKENWETAPQD